MLTVNFQSRMPVYQQLYDDVIRLTAVGVLEENSKLPPVRTLATELGINPNTVQKAYKMLENDGYIYSTVGRGSYVSEKLCMDKAEKIRAKDELKKSMESAYRKGITKREMYSMVDNISKGAGK